VKYRDAAENAPELALRGGDGLIDMTLSMSDEQRSKAAS
jgi:hypothetical protein